MDVNRLPVTSNARQITGRCLLGGVNVPFVSCEVNNNAFYQADTFSVTFATSGLPKGYDLKWFSTQTDIEVELFVGIVGKTGIEWQSLIIGRADSLHYDPARFEVVLEGRDLTSYLIDNKSSAKWPNQTASQIAVAMANKYGLKPVVTPTKTKAGTYYQIDHVDVQSERTDWDLLTYLAGVEGFQVYVKGRELHFERLIDQSKADNYVIRWVAPGSLAYPQANVSDDLRFERNLTLAKGVTVQVRSWNSKQKQPFTVSYPTNSAKGIAPGQSNSKRQVYSITRAGLDQDGAMQLAQSMHHQITRHEMRLSGSTAGDNLLMPNTLIRIEGTGSAFDQLYYCDSIRRSLSFGDGYRMSFTAKNNNPNSNPLV